jgi:hypothetical protein
LGATQNIDIKNCIITQGGYYGKYATGASADLSNNNVWNNSEEDYTGISAGSGDISAGPGFLSMRNFRLNSTLPCIGAGRATDAPDGDISEVPRPIGSGVDIGAHEYFSSYSGERTKVVVVPMSL